MPTYAANLLPDTTGRDLGSTDQRWDGNLQDVDISGVFTLGSGSVQFLWGIGDPSAGSGTVATRGSVFLRTDGSTSTTLYIKTGDADTAWTAK